MICAMSSASGNKMEVGLSLGANLGNRLHQLQETRNRIIATKGITLLAKSPVYETEPVEVPPTDRDMFFLNAVLIVETPLKMPELLLGFQKIERQLGRAPDSRPNARRPIDIDIIYADDLSLNVAGIIIPHPRWSGRRFVVQPLNDVRPDLVIAGQNGTVAELLSNLSDAHRVILYAKEW